MSTVEDTRWSRMLKRSRLFFLVATLGVGLLGGTASALTAEEQILMFGTGPEVPEMIILYGDAFTGVGTRALLGSGRQDWDFDQGTLSVRVIPQPRTETLDETTCEHTIVVEQHLTVVGGTGVFDGASGEGAFTNTRQVVHLTGPEGCQHESLFEFTIIEGSITLTLPSVEAA